MGQDVMQTTSDPLGNTPGDEEGSVDYSQLIQQEAFVGDMPYDAIVEGITDQFNDYIQMEDTTNFVDVFYDQLHASYESLDKDEEENHRTEFKEVLDKIHQEFVEFMTKQFEERLTLTIMMLESESLDYDDLEFIIRRLYEFFILGAKNNFKVVIATDINARLKDVTEDDNTYFKQLQELMLLYSPLLTSIKPTEFLKIRGDMEIAELFDNGQVVGNFLRKYSPKFYQNEEFQVEVINYVTMTGQLGKELADGGQ